MIKNKVLTKERNKNIWLRNKQGVPYIVFFNVKNERFCLMPKIYFISKTCYKCFIIIIGFITIQNMFLRDNSILLNDVKKMLEIFCVKHIINVYFLTFVIFDLNLFLLIKALKRDQQTFKKFQSKGLALLTKKQK